MTGPADAAALLGWARSQVWAMEPRALEAMTGALVSLSRGQSAGLKMPSTKCLSKSPVSLSEAMAAAMPRRRSAPRSEIAIAVLPVFGIITYRGLFGGTATVDLLSDLRRVVDDPDVKSIIMPIDSPGGTVPGVPEVAAALRAARAKKRIVAVVDPFTASAAYWIASSASEIVSIPSGETGSIGVFALHLDFSEELKQAGIKPTFIASTPEKVEGSGLEPLSADARTDMQRNVDRVYRAFLSDVARGRGIDVATVKQTFGRGRVIDAARARSAGMIDRIGGFEQALGIASDAKRHGPVSLSPSAPARAVSFTEMSASQRRRRLEELERG